MEYREPLETQIKTKILKRLRNEPNGWFFKVFGGSYQVAGLPDILGVWKGWPLALEVKRPETGRVSAIQLSVLRHLAKAGAVTAVVTSVEDVEKVLFIPEWCSAEFERLGTGATNPKRMELFLRTWYNKP